MQKFRSGDSVLAFRRGEWKRAEIVDCTYQNAKSTAAHPGDLYIVRFADKHRTSRYAPEIRGN